MLVAAMFDGSSFLSPLVGYVGKKVPMRLLIIYPSLLVAVLLLAPGVLSGATLFALIVGTTFVIHVLPLVAEMNMFRLLYPPTHPGSLRINYLSPGLPQTTMILREDVVLEVGDYVQVDVAFTGGAATQDLRVGVGLSSSLGRDAMGGQDLANVLYWGLRNDGRVRGHYYGDSGMEIGDGELQIAGYQPGNITEATSE